MKTLKKDLQGVVKDLRALTLKMEKIGKELDNLAEARGSAGPRTRRAAKARAATRRVARKSAGRGAKERTAMAVVFDLIGKRKKGATTTVIKNKTGFDDKKIWNVINRLKTQGKIKSAQRGLYVKI